MADNGNILTQHSYKSHGVQNVLKSDMRSEPAQLHQVCTELLASLKLPCRLQPTLSLSRWWLLLGHTAGTVLDPSHRHQRRSPQDTQCMSLGWCLWLRSQGGTLQQKRRQYVVARMICFEDASRLKES